MSTVHDVAELTRRMEGALKSLHHEFTGLRTGRASVNLLDTINVEAYGSHMPLNQVGTVSAPEARLLVVSVWDKSMVKAVEKSIQNAGLGLNPMSDGQLVRVPLPEMSEERRKEMVKIAAKYAEETRIAVRNVRRDGMDYYKKLQKDSKISEDELHRHTDEIQKLTDQFIQKVDESLVHKEKDIMSV
jgi:ribosome recycling factor